MGLDITAYRTAVFERAMRSDEDPDTLGNAFRFIYTVPAFAAQADGMQSGFYRVPSGDAVHAFPAGSYSGYNHWREWLCRLVHAVAPSTLWHDTTGKYAGAAFFELINFADNEGVIGPKTSAKLAKDFAEWQDRADAAGAEARGYLGLFNDFRKAFKLAAGNGCVKFH